MTPLIQEVTNTGDPLAACSQHMSKEDERRATLRKRETMGSGTNGVPGFVEAAMVAHSEECTYVVQKV